MSDKIPLSVLTKLIKPYNGDRESLPAFLTNCDNAISLANSEQQSVLYRYIISQLEGKAQIACSLKTFNSWDELKIFLKTTFGEKKHSTHLLIELQNCRQGNSETVMQYSLRIESCLTRLQSDIHYSCENKSELVGRIAAMEDLALNTFILGLNSNYGYIVRCRNPKKLSEAITHAIEEEKLYILSKISSKSYKQCSICQKSGHDSSSWYNNKKKQSHRAYYVNPQINNYPNSHNISNKNFIQICSYCKNPGHMINECRKRQYNNSIRRNMQPDTRPTTALPSPSAHTPNRNNMHLCNAQPSTSSADICNEDLN
ncbi:unnamed protein product [Parnassius mnemosyne]|uniref:CCHC-type domain-containing protein n=1 Tax=Parnassius mnemosyne TaxID=213953 RepID=A0AAV1LUV4_9NEOP